MGIILKPQKEFPHLQAFKDKFNVTKKTIFAWDNVIYCDYELPNHLIIHERTHHLQQNRDGLEKWLHNYLNDDEQRLKYEIEAYTQQIKVVSDKNAKTRLRYECAKNLASDLYGNIISFEDALIKIK